MEFAIICNDVLTNIFKLVDYGSDYKAILFTCRYWYNFLTQNKKEHEDRVDNFSNHLLTLLKMNEKKSNIKWNLQELDKNPNISWNYYKNHRNNKYSYGPSSDQHITQEIISQNLFWWDWEYLSAHPFVTWEFVLKHTEYSWNDRGLGINPNITFEIASSLEYRNKFSVRYFSANPNVTWDLVQQHTNFPWNWDLLTINRNMTAKIILDNPDRWNYRNLCYNLSLFIDENTDTLLEKYHNNINWSIMQSHPNADFNRLLQHAIEPNYPNLDNYYLKNPNFLKESKDTINIEYGDVSYLSENPDLTWRIVMNNPHIKWDFYAMSGNLFNKYNYSSYLLQLMRIRSF